MAAKTAAEYKRDQRARDAAREREEEESIFKLFVRPFNKYWAEYELDPNFNEYTLPLEISGIQPPDFSEDRDFEAEDGGFYLNDRGVFGRAERVAECLVTAGEVLASVIRDYKLIEIEKAMTQIMSTDFDTADAKAQAFRDFAILERMKRKLNKQKN